MLLQLCCLVLSNSVTPRTVAHQAPLSVGILQARILEWVAMPSFRDLPNPGIKPSSPALQEGSLPSESPGKPIFYCYFTSTQTLTAVDIVSVCVCVCVLSPTLCDPVDCSPPDSSVHGILQARKLEWVAISFSRASS